MIPPGYEILRSPVSRPASKAILGRLFPAGSRTIVLKSSFRDRLLEAGVTDPRRMAEGPLVADWIGGGRVLHALIRMDGGSWVLKAYRRGGILGHVNSSRYWGSRRFQEELRVAAHAEAVGIPTAEVLALVVEPAGFGAVRAWLITRYLPGARPLQDYWGKCDAAGIFRSAGQVVRRMHEAGIDHRDLHLGNIVGWIDSQGPHACIVDWDRARSRESGTWNPHTNLVRLWRSVEKGRHRGDLRVEREGDAVRSASPSIRAFIRGYFSGHVADLREARQYFRRRALLLGLRTLFWSKRK